MTDDPQATPQPGPETVRRSLRALADGSASAARPTAVVDNPEYDRLVGVVDDAYNTLSCAREAATFLRAGRLSELAAAIEAADRRGHDDIARRGRQAGEALRALDGALGCPDTSAAEGQEADHFHPTRGTVLGRSEQSPNR